MSGDPFTTADQIARRLFEAQQRAIREQLPHYDDVFEEAHGERPTTLRWETMPEEGRQLWRATAHYAGLV